MKKARNTYLIIWAICLAVFNVVVFVVPNSNTSAENFWIGYVLITLSFVGNLICSFIALNAKNNSKVFYNIPLVTVSIAGIVIASIVGAIFMIIPDIQTWIGVVISFIVLAVVAVAALTAKSAADIVGGIDDKIKTQTSFIKGITLDAELLMASASAPEIKNEIKKVYEAFRFSDPMSNEQLSEIEDRIQYQFNLLSEVVISGDKQRVVQISTDLVNLIDYRNKKCKITK